MKQAKWKALIAETSPLHAAVCASFSPLFRSLLSRANVETARKCLRPSIILHRMSFLDIQMPGIDGFEVIKRRTVARMPAVVFLTAFDEFAIKAFETEALDIS